jgi:hypothetical protein
VSAGTVWLRRRTLVSGQRLKGVDFIVRFVDYSCGEARRRRNRYRGKRVNVSGIVEELWGIGEELIGGEEMQIVDVYRKLISEWEFGC